MEKVSKNKHTVTVRYEDADIKKEKSILLEKYQEIFENVKDAIFVHEITPDGLPGRFVAVNREARERMGYSLEEFLSMSPADLDAEESSKNTPAIESIIKEKKSICTNTVNDKKKQLLKGCMPAGSDIQSLICVPVPSNNKVRSIIHLDSTEKNAFSYEDVQFTEFLAKIVSFTIERIDLFHRIEEISIRDGLTGCFNRRKFDMDIVDEVNRAKRYHRDLSLLMIDIDWFKKYNDYHKHTSGDNVLRELVKLIHIESRKTDRLYRYGGEEFVLILPETEKLEAIKLAKYLREKVEEKLFAGEELSQPKKGLTISIGVSSFPDDGKDKKILINAADKALYTAKENGRNRVCSA